RAGAARAGPRGADGAQGRVEAGRDGAGARRPDARRTRPRDGARARGGRVSGPEALVRSPEGGMSGYKDALKKFAHGVLDPLVRLLLAIGLTADHLTAFGFVLSLIAGLEFATGRFRLAAALATAGGLCDILDGQLARQSGKVTRFGAFLDSTLDRIAEAALFVGL